MAYVEQFLAQMGFLTSDRKTVVVSLRVSEIEGLLWLNQLPGVLRDGTEVGLLFQAIQGMTNATLLYEGVQRHAVDDAVDYPAPSAEVYSFDKFGVSFKSGLDNYNFTIPGRKMSVVVPEADGVTIPISGAGASAEVLALVAAVNDVVLAKNGGDAVVTGLKVVS